ncbi:hypothetical protein Droror1_Dr00024179, partial [Drosera rotundifolia]
MGNHSQQFTKFAIEASSLAPLESVAAQDSRNSHLRIRPRLVSTSQPRAASSLFDHRRDLSRYQENSPAPSFLSDKRHLFNFGDFGVVDSGTPPQLPSSHSSFSLTQ